MVSRLFLLVSGVALLAFATPSSGNHGNEPVDALVFITDSRYDPGNGVPFLEVPSGALIGFVNVDNLIHTVDSNVLFEVHSGSIASGEHFAMRAPAPGVYEIHCATNALHTAQMHMVLRVT